MGKYPSRVENLEKFEVWVCFRYCVLRLISSARVKPKIVMIRAVSFRCRGIVIRGVVVGGILLVRIKPAKMLPISRRLMGLIDSGLFSLMSARGGKRGCPSSAKKMMRVL